MKVSGIVLPSAAMALVVCAAATGHTKFQEDSAKPQRGQQWQYKVTEIPLADAAAQESVLNELGSEGWELVSTELNRQSAGAVYLATLKRPSS
jgi:hypothetical protein